MRLALVALISLVAAAQTAPLTLPTYDMYRYAVAGRPFSYKFGPAGGIAPYTFAVEEGSSLPPGMQLDVATGALSGTTPQLGEFRHTVCISDAAKARICVPFLVIAVANEGDTYTELIPARVTTEYQNLLPNLTGLTELSYLPASGKIPDGMVLEVTGRLYGIPRAPGGAWAFKTQGRDAGGNPAFRTYLIRVLGPLAATTAMPSGYSGLEYSGQFTVLGDAPPHVWTVRRGPLPPGYILTETGRLSGFCNQPARYQFTLRVTDASGASHDRDIVLNVDFAPPPLQITSGALPGATFGVAYRQQVGITGGREPYAFRATGSVPPGLTMSPTGLLTGTPTSAGTFLFTVQVTDITGTTLYKSFAIAVGNLRYSGPSTVSIYALEPLKAVLTAEGGTAPYKWALASGALPAGVALSETGELAGTPSAAGATAATVRVTDAAGRVVENPLAITVNPARPVISANGTVNGASFAVGGITPGEIVTIFGLRMGPATLAPFILDNSGRVPTALAGTRVLFGGQPAPLLYVSAGQIGTIVPYGATGRASIDVVVDANGVRSEAVNIPLVGSAPGLFTVDSSGSGQAAALNQDGTVNGRTQPARPGDVVVLFGTGEGQVLPSGQDGALTGVDTPRPVLPIKVALGGKEGQILYAGAAPGLVAGVFQINVRIPMDVAGDSVTVVLRVGEAASIAGVTLAIR